MLAEAISPQIIETIQSTVRTMLGDYDITSCEIAMKEDAAGDDAIFVDVRYRLSTAEFDPQKSAGVRSAIWRKLYDLGERRVPYIRHHLPEGQIVKATHVF